MSNDKPMPVITGKCIKGKHCQCHSENCECRCHIPPVRQPKRIIDRFARVV